MCVSCMQQRLFLVLQVISRQSGYTNCTRVAAMENASQTARIVYTYISETQEERAETKHTLRSSLHLPAGFTDQPSVERSSVKRVVSTKQKKSNIFFVDFFFVKPLPSNFNFPRQRWKILYTRKINCRNFCDTYVTRDKIESQIYFFVIL